jgi:predicted RNA methylase
LFPPTSYSYRAAELGAAYEATLPAGKRKRLGAWYTPRDLALAIAARALRSVGSGRPLTVLDPACGAGVFLAAVRELAGEVRLCGVDVDPGAVELARKALPEGTFAVGEALLGVDFGGAFPEVMAQGGFDLVITNPPYVRADVSALRARVHASGHFASLRGKWDLSLAFVERGLQLLRPGGRAVYLLSDSYERAAYARFQHAWLGERLVRMEILADRQFAAGVGNLVLELSASAGESGPEPANGRDDRRGSPAGAKSLDDLCYISYGLRANSDERRWPGEFVTADLLADAPDAHHPRAYVEGKDLGGLRVLRRRFLEWDTDRAPARFARRSFDAFLTAAPKILALCISGDRVVCALDEAGHLFNHTIVGIVPWHLLRDCPASQVRKAARDRDLAQAPDFDVRYILAILTSARTRDFVASVRRSRKHIYPDDWRAVPIPAAPPGLQAAIARAIDAALAQPYPSAGFDSAMASLAPLLDAAYDASAGGL